MKKIFGYIKDSLITVVLLCLSFGISLICGVNMIRDNTPEWIMSYDYSLWYEIYFENGVAVEVKLRKGYIGG